MTTVNVNTGCNRLRAGPAAGFGGGAGGLLRCSRCAAEAAGRHVKIAAMTAPPRAARARRPAASDDRQTPPAASAAPPPTAPVPTALPATGRVPDLAAVRPPGPPDSLAPPAAEPDGPSADAPARAGSRRRYGGVAPEVRQRQRRERLIEAGLQVFGTRGFHGATVREVCAVAQLTERYFYESFAGLPALFEAVYTGITDELHMKTLSALMAQPPDADGMAEAALRVFYETIRADACRARICLIEAVSVGPLGGELGSESARQYTALMRHFLSLLYVEEGFDDLDLDLLAAGLIGMNIHIATEWVRGGFATPMERVIATNMAAYRALGAAFASRRRQPGA